MSSIQIVVVIIYFTCSNHCSHERMFRAPMEQSVKTGIIQSQGKVRDFSFFYCILLTYFGRLVIFERDPGSGSCIYFNPTLFYLQHVMKKEITSQSKVSPTSVQR